MIVLLTLCTADIFLTDVDILQFGVNGIVSCSYYITETTYSKSSGFGSAMK